MRSARNAEFFRSDRPWAAISVSSCEDFPVLDEENRVGLLRLAFKDTAEPGKSGSFSASLATEILDFMERMWDQVESLLVLTCSLLHSAGPSSCSRDRALCRAPASRGSRRQAHHHRDAPGRSDRTDRLRRGNRRPRTGARVIKPPADERKKGGASISLAMAEQIQRLHSTGVLVAKIAAQVGVHGMNACWHIKRSGGASRRSWGADGQVRRDCRRS